MLAPLPQWANELLEEIKQVKKILETVDKIEKTVDLICVKLSDIGTNMKNLEVRVIETENSCDYMSNMCETNKTEISSAKDEIK